MSEIDPVAKKSKKFAIIFILVFISHFSFDSIVLRGAKQYEITHVSFRKNLDEQHGSTSNTELTGLRNSNVSGVGFDDSDGEERYSFQRGSGKDKYNEDDVVGTTENMFHFCRNSQVSVTRKELKPSEQTKNERNVSLSLLYQCSGGPYEEFAKHLHRFAETCPTTYNNATFRWKRMEEDTCSAYVPSFPLKPKSNEPLHHYSWGKREFPLVDNTTVLAIGNSHLRQISKTLACQYAHKLTNVHILPAIGESTTANNNGHDQKRNINNSASVESFVLEFSNHARWISITNRVLFYSKEWNELIEEFYLKTLQPLPALPFQPSEQSEQRHFQSLSVENMDAIVLGKFTTYEQAKGTNFERTMNDEEESYYNFSRREYHQRRDGLANSATRRERGLKRSKTKRIKKKANSDNSSESSKEYDAESIFPVAAEGDVHSLKTNRKTRTVSFATIPPPDIVDVAGTYTGPIISLSMFSKSDKARVLSSYGAYREQCLHARRKQQERNNPGVIQSTIHSSNKYGNDTGKKPINTNLYLINGRRYIEKMGIECGTDDKTTMGTCHESPKNVELEITTTNKKYRDPSDMHRCAGLGGGHADLVSWDVIEGLYSTTMGSSLN